MGYSPVFVLEDMGHADGLWILVEDGHNYAISVFDSCAFSCMFSIEKRDNKWFCTGLYASPIPANHPPFWHHLCNLNKLFTTLGRSLGTLMKFFSRGIKEVVYFRI